MEFQTTESCAVPAVKPAADADVQELAEGSKVIGHLSLLTTGGTEAGERQDSRPRGWSGDTPPGIGFTGSSRWNGAYPAAERLPRLAVRRLLLRTAALNPYR